MSYEVLARKYRPTNFEEVIGQDHVVKALKNSIKTEKIHQAYIFAGTRGVGKTTLARILAKCMNCESDTKPTPHPCNKCSNTIEINTGRSVDFLEIDAASNTGVDKMRQLIEGVEYKPAKSRYNIYLIDEVHMLSTASFNALLKTLEEPPSHSIFIFATTKPDSIPKTVQSRCLQLNLKTVSEEDLIKHLKKILKNEEVKYDDESIALIANSASGSVRDALTMLDQAIAHGNGILEKGNVTDLLGTIDNSLIMSLIKSIIDGDGVRTFNIFSQIEELSPEYDAILKNLISIFHQIAIEQVLKTSDDKEIKEISNVLDKEFCQLLYEISLNAYSKFNAHPSPKEALEMCILRMLAFNPLVKISDNEVNSSNNLEKKSLKKIINDKQNTNSTKNIESSEETHFKNNNDWINLFNSLSISPFARNYFGNMSFESYKNMCLTLSAEKEFSNVPENIMLEFQTELDNLLKEKIQINIIIGEVVNSPLLANKEKEKTKQDLSEKDINNNKDIQQFINKFNGKLKTESIKPIK